MRQRPWARLVAAVGGGVGLALLAPVLAAVGQVSPPDPVLEIGPTAQLVAQGAAVAVPVHVVVTCPAGGQANVNVQVVQAVDREVGHAFGNAEVDCDGTPQDVVVFATSQDLTFRPGPAFATATLFCSSGPPFPGSSCSAQAQREILIVSGSGPLPTLPPTPTIPPSIPPPSIPPVPGFPFPDLTQLLASILQLIGFPFGAAV